MMISGVNLSIIHIWVAILIITVAIEALSLNLMSIWFSLGALAALIMASLGFNIGIQLVGFVVVSALLLLLLRPITRKFLVVRGERTNADRIIGQNAVVTVAIDNSLSQGEIKLLGQVWSARSSTDETIEEGASVCVRSIIGVKAIVERAK